MKNYFSACNTLDEAKKAYKKLCFELHPDYSGRNSGYEFAQMKEQFGAFKPKTEKYEGEQDAWNAPEYMTVIERLMKIDNAKIEICGSWIYISGTVKEQKEEIKNSCEGIEMLKVQWARKKKIWCIRPSNYKSKSRGNYSMDQIRNKYGSKKFEGEKKRQIS